MMGQVGQLGRGVEYDISVWQEARMEAKHFWGVVFAMRGAAGLFGLKRDGELGRSKGRGVHAPQVEASIRGFHYEFNVL
jgi:hypothetical protein